MLAIAGESKLCTGFDARGNASRKRFPLHGLCRVNLQQVPCRSRDGRDFRV